MRLSKVGLLVASCGSAPGDGAFEFVAVRRTWKQDRVFFLVENGTLTSVPTTWTDAAGPDALLAISAGRSRFRVEDLLALADLVETPRPHRRPAEACNAVTSR